MTLLIDAARSDDIPAIAAIYAHAVTHGTASFELMPPDAAEMHDRFAAITAAGYPYLAARQDGRLLGSAYASAYRPRAAYRSTVENSIYVSPDAQGAGIGGALLDALIEACASSGFRQMIAVIGDGTAETSASRRLHERAGFRIVGTAEKVGFKQGRWLDQLLMQRALGEDAEAPPTLR